MNLHDLHDYQRPIADHAAAAILTGGRTQIVMACGTGKTLTGMRTVEDVLDQAGLPAPVIALAFPNLTLLSQTAKEWRNQSKWRTPLGQPDYADLAVCSHATIDTHRRVAGVEEDHAAENLDDLMASGVAVPGPRLAYTTDPDQVARFLTGHGRRVLFVTYQSMPVLAQALAATGVRLDVVLADEAHRTAGPDADAEFGMILDDEAIPADRRLFMTATRRIVTTRSKGGKADARSMDDPTLYGLLPREQEYTFRRAIEAGRLLDYQVHVIQVTQTEVETFTGAPLSDLEREVSAGRSGSKANAALAAVALAKMARHHRLHRVMAFHARVASSKQFVHELQHAQDLLTTDQHKVNTRLHAVHVDGSTPAAERAAALGALTHAQPGLGEWVVVTNVGVFTEGVDVPNLDAVVFADPRSSEVDVAQIVGRALRVPRGVRL